MGKTSKFSFPIPGRKYKGSEENLSARSAGPPSINFSKAQRILGTASDLYIDSPGAYVGDEEGPWKYARSETSFISIAVSETTKSGHSVHESGSPILGNEPGTPLNSRPSSTLLGGRYGDDALAPPTDVSGRLRKEDSSSTLRSYYDRKKSPLAISQQTSDSSARDLALRKGLPTIKPSRPLVKIDHFVETHGDMVDLTMLDRRAVIASSPAGKDSRKKPGRLDFSLLVPRSMRHGERSPLGSPSPSLSSPSKSYNGDLLPPNSSRRRLVKMNSKESVTSARQVTDVQRPAKIRSQDSTNSLSQLYEHYAQLPMRSPRLDPSPKPTVGEMSNNKQADQSSHYEDLNRSKETSPANGTPRSGLAERSRQRIADNQHLAEVSSAKSISSRKTKSSRRTDAGAISRANLHESSVLSLSSDSEEDDSDRPATFETSSSRSSPGALESKHRRGLTTAPAQNAGLGISNGPLQQTYLPTTSEFEIDPRLSGPWYPESRPTVTTSGRASRSSLSGKRVSNGYPTRLSVRTTSSVTSVRTGREDSLQPTPPLSPTSMEFRQSSEFSSRFMAVTKQEEALLEALRQKKARMREKIIEEHITTTSPPRMASRPASVATSVNTASGNRESSGKQSVLFYLDTPLIQKIDAPEPSPDLSDFLTFGSDDSTPRNSWVAGGKGRSRPDATSAPRSPLLLDSHLQFPDTPNSSGPRISAVGPPPGFAINDTKLGPEVNTSASGIRFIDDMNMLAQDMLLGDTETIW